jgi:cAMP-dependent protein kinase regulator
MSPPVPTTAHSPQRQPARNIFAKPLLLQNVMTAATNTATNTATTAQQHVQKITQAFGTMMTTAAATTTTTLSGKMNQKLPYYEKSSAIKTFLMKALATNFVFEHCTEQEIQQLCDSMEPYPVPIGTTIIQQGEPIGDYFYIIYEGTVTFIVDQVTVGTASSGQQFGELSLLYSAPRAATVIATSAASSSATDSNNQETTPMIQLYRLDQITFRTILQQQTLNVSDEYMNLLRKVKFLADLDDYDLYKLSSVLQKHTYTKDTVIVQKGDTVANVCYILLEGTVTCSEISVNDGSCTYSDMVLSQPGDYFGERAILTGEPRAATVTATTDHVTCYTIDKLTFDTVLGNYQSIIIKANEERLLVRVCVYLVYLVGCNCLLLLIVVILLVAMYNSFVEPNPYPY